MANLQTDNLVCINKEVKYWEVLNIIIEYIFLKLYFHSWDITYKLFSLVVTNTVLWTSFAFSVDFAQSISEFQCLLPPYRKQNTKCWY